MSGKANLFDGVTDERLAEESFTELLSRPGVRIERIVSTGQSTAFDTWMEQAWDEWVLLAEGRAGLTLEGRPSMTLSPGDHVLVPAHVRHRVDWTDTPTVWLAVHMGEPG